MFTRPISSAICPALFPPTQARQIRLHNCICRSAREAGASPRLGRRSRSSFGRAAGRGVGRANGSPCQAQSRGVSRVNSRRTPGGGATRPPSARRLSSAVNLRPVAGPPRRLGGGRRAPRRASRPISAESRDARQQVGNWRGSRRRPLRGAGSRAAGFRSPFSFAEVRETTTALVGCDLCNPVRLFDEARAKGLQIRFSLCADQKRSICGSSLNFQSKRLDMVRGFSWACYDFYENINCFSHLLLM